MKNELAYIEVTNTITGRKSIVTAHRTRAFERLNHENRWSYQSARILAGKEAAAAKEGK